MIEVSICRTCGQIGHILNNFGECQDCTKKRAAGEAQDTGVSEREKELEQLVKDWREFFHVTALSIGEKKAEGGARTVWDWDTKWIDRHLNLEVRSRRLLNEGKVKNES